MKNIITHIISNDSNCLAYSIMNTGTDSMDLRNVGEMIELTWKELTPYIHNNVQMLIIRNITDSMYDFPFGNCFTPFEANIYVPNWNDQTGLNASIHHELHHMARWNGPGYGQTLGEAIVTEGFATAYEEYSTSWSAPVTHQNIPDKLLKRVLTEWENKNYDHQAWFNGSDELPPFIGYAIGRHIINKVMPRFSLEDSVKLTADQVLKKYQLENRT